MCRWVVVLPCGSRNLQKPFKLELAIYAGAQVTWCLYLYLHLYQYRNVFSGVAYKCKLLTVSRCCCMHTSALDPLAHTQNPTGQRQRETRMEKLTSYKYLWGGFSNHPIESYILLKCKSYSYCVNDRNVFTTTDHVFLMFFYLFFVRMPNHAQLFHSGRPI